ncbi:MAG: hypothetical protein AAF497_03850 [Planctomycetota bacterium]
MNGSPLLFGGSGNDLIVGGDGIDMIAGGDGDDQIWGGQGSDYLWGESHDDTIYGGPGDDHLWGDEFSNGTANTADYGDDFIVASDGQDQAFGNLGDDGFEGDQFDQWDGGGGFDTIFDGTNIGSDSTPEIEWIGSPYANLLDAGQFLDVYEGGSVSFGVGAIDLDGDQLYYSASFNGPSSVGTLPSSSTDGHFTFTAGNSNTTDHTSVHSVTVTVSTAPQGAGQSQSNTIPVRIISEPSISLPGYFETTSPIGEEVVIGDDTYLVDFDLEPLQATVWAGAQNGGIGECIHGSDYGCGDIDSSSDLFVYPRVVNQSGTVNVTPDGSSLTITGDGVSLANSTLNATFDGAGGRAANRVVITAEAPNGLTTELSTVSNTRSWTNLLPTWDGTNFVPTDQFATAPVAPDAYFSATAGTISGPFTIGVANAIDTMFDPSDSSVGPEFQTAGFLFGQMLAPQFSTTGNTLEFQYTANAGFFGIDSATYKFRSDSGVFDEEENSTTGVIRIAVGEYNVTEVRKQDEKGQA